MAESRIIGRCSICGGPITEPTTWAGNTAPAPLCEHCDTVAGAPYESVLGSRHYVRVGPPKRSDLIGRPCWTDPAEHEWDDP